MSVVATAQIASALTTIFEDRIASQINRATVLLQVLPVGNGTTGKNITWAARFGTAVGAARAEGADVTTFDNDDKIPASLEFGTYDTSFSVTGKAMAMAAAAKNPDEIANLFVDELGDSVERLAKGVGQDLWSGSGAANFIFGLLATGGPLSNTGTYAGIDRGVRAQWQSNVSANGGVGRALTFDVMRGLRTQIYRASGVKPDLIITTPELYNKYGTLFGQQRRYVTDIRLRGQQIVLDGGFTMLEFDGVPILEDVDCPTGNMVMLSTACVRVLQLPDQVSMANQSMAMIAVAGTPEEQLGQPTGKLTARIHPLGPKGDAYPFQLIIYPQLQCRHPFRCGVIKDLDAAL